jgi:CubicO group peptidase (beta-lactamase class C family)
MAMQRLRAFLAGLALALAAFGFALPAHAQAPPVASEGVPRLDPALLSETMARAAQLPRLHALIVAHHGTPVVEKVFRGGGLDRTTNIKSASKSIISALVGIAIARGHIRDVEQPFLPLLGERSPDGLDAKVGTITVGNLLSMQSGLDRTSGPNYGRWVSSGNWVRYVVSRPFVDEPGGSMLYSTGNTHVLSAILTEVTGKSTLELAREWLGEPLEIQIPAWTRDPQGIYFGGNEMALSPRALLRIGEMYRGGGVYAGKRVVPEAWVRTSWTPKVVGRGGQLYGYGWFITQSEGHPIYYGWGFGGQMIYVIPTLAMTVIATSDSSTRSVEDDYRCQLHGLVNEGFMPAVLRANPGIVAPPRVLASWSYPPLGGDRCGDTWVDGPG